MSSDRENRGEVLVVDDDTVVVFVVGQALRAAGWVVRTARHSAHAIDAVAKRPPRIIVCDLHMPEMNGLELIGHLKDLAPAIPVIVLSADNKVSSVLDTVRAGAFDYVIKGTDWSEVSDAVERADAHVLRQAAQRGEAAGMDARLTALERQESSYRAMLDGYRSALQATRGTAAQTKLLAETFRAFATTIEAGQRARAAGHDPAALDARRQRLWNDLVALSQAVAGPATATGDLDYLDVAEALGATVAQVGAELAATGVRIDMKSMAATTMHTDRDALRVLMEAILRLAASLTERKRLELAMTTRAVVSGARVEIEVQLPGATLGNPYLGLRTRLDTDPAVVRARLLCAGIGGTLAITNTARGSTITLRLPLAHTSGDAWEDRPGRRRLRHRNVDTFVLGGADPALAESIRSRLPRGLVRTVFKATVREVLRAVAEENPTVVVLDAVLEDGDGYDVLRQLKDDPEVDHVPVFMISGADDRGAAMALGAAAQLRKPLSRTALPRALSALGMARLGGPAVVLDGDPTYRSELGHLLIRESWAFEETGDVDGAISLLRGSRLPSALIIDVALPGGSGLVVVETMAADPELREIPVIALTSAHLSEDQRAYLAAHTSAIVPKGPDMEVTLDTVQAALQAAVRGATPPPFFQVPAT